MTVGEGWVEYRKKTSREMSAKWRRMKQPPMAEKYNTLAAKIITDLTRCSSIVFELI